jgi:hypothetical protein
MTRTLKCLRIVLCAAAAGAVILAASPATAFFHLWQISEVFSNSDGSVQFIELSTSSSSQTFTNGTQIKSSSTGHTFTFNANLSSDTVAPHTHLLLATENFGSIAGAVAPDFPTIFLPPNFFNPAGDTITYVGTITTPATFGPSPSTPLPTDGVHSLAFPGASSQVNSPTNFAGNAGSIFLSAPTPTGDYNGNNTVDAADYTVWRDTLGQTVSPKGSGADGNANGTIDNADYSFWVNHFGTVLPGAGAGAAAAAPETPTLPLLIVGMLLVALARYAR